MRLEKQDRTTRAGCAALRQAIAALLVAAAIGASPAQAGDLAVAWLRDGRVQTGSTSASITDSVPLGSLWKLWVYAYAVERSIDTPAYRCATSRRPEEEYCCDPGGAIERERALARSCGLFFQPSRLGIGDDAWRAFWQPRTRAESAWLADLSQLRPDTRVTVSQVLYAVDAIPPSARGAAARALLPLMLDGYGRDAVTHLGATLRVKTFTWDHPRRPGASLGGAAGWLVDGTPVWFAAAGASRNVLRDHAAQLLESLPKPREQAIDDACVLVDFFARYPIRAVDALPAREPAPGGRLNGRYRVAFVNGNTLVFSSEGQLWLDRVGAQPRIQGRLTLADYIARVLDREADANATEAARALAVVARTWLIENAEVENGCFHAADSSRAQRVSANPPSQAALQAALFTDGLVLRGQPARYRLDDPAPGVLAWTRAMEQARRGLRYDAILASAFPQASLAAVSGEQECSRIAEAESWLARTLPRWRLTLNGEPGFSPPAQPVSICALAYGDPYSDQSRLRIYLRQLRTREDRITLAHEYLHLAFRSHPRGADEAFVERMARVLADG